MSSSNGSDNSGCMAAIGKIVTYLLVLLCFNALVSSFAHTQAAISAAEADGLTNIHVLSDNWVFPEIDGCNPFDPKEVTLTATNLRGQTVMVHVCITEWHNANVNTEYVISGAPNR